MDEKFKNLLILFVALTVIEVGLMLAGVLPPLTSGSVINTLFSLAKLAIIAYAGWIFAHQGLKAAAIKGSILMAAGIFVLFLVSIISYAMTPNMLNLDSVSYLVAAWGLMLLINVLAGIIIAVASALISNFVNKKSRKEKRKKK